MSTPVIKSVDQVATTLHTTTAVAHKTGTATPIAPSQPKQGFALTGVVISTGAPWSRSFPNYDAATQFLISPAGADINVTGALALTGGFVA